MEVVVTVGHVQARHIHPRLRKRLNHFFIGGCWTDGTDNFRFLITEDSLFM